MISPKASAEVGFSFRSERLCLDFAATEMFRGTARPHELLDSPVKLSVWAVGSGVVSDLTPCDKHDLRDATELREVIYRLAAGFLGGNAAAVEDLALLNKYGLLAPVTVALSADRTLTHAGTMKAVLATIARDTIELLGGPDAQHLRQCGREGCTRMFIDRSRGRNRTWCGMRECGNRVNAAAYRRRKHQ